MHHAISNSTPTSPAGNLSKEAGGGTGTAEDLPPVVYNGNSGYKRNRSFAGLTDLSPGSEADYEGGDGGEARRKLGVKRACNDCRQQKLRCNVVQNPFSPCDRCNRLKLECKIESNFKRVGKRNKHAEMERELNELRAKVARQSSISSYASPPQRTLHHSPEIKVEGSSKSEDRRQDEYMGNHEAVASLLDLRQGNNGPSSRKKGGSGSACRTLGSSTLSSSDVSELFEQYWQHCHPWLPILDPSKTPDRYFELSELLFWSIICVSARRFPKDAPLLTALCPAMAELIWARIGRVPQSYHIVKAMCLLCTWPLPTSSTSTDPTLMISGVMMTVAMHFGLHRPSHAQDFSKFRVELREENLVDRVKTWAACNIVAQNVSTGYGQPPFTLYDWTLASDASKEKSFQLSPELESRLKIEKFCDKVTKTLYSNKTDPLGLIAESQRLAATNLLGRELEELVLLLQPHSSDLDQLHLRAAGLHLRIGAFFDSPSHPDYRNDLLKLYFATQEYLEVLFGLESFIQSYATNYILQITVVAGFVLLKLLNSFFSSFIDIESGRKLFARTIRTIRNISVQTNDLPSRLAEVLSQMWAGSAISSGGAVTSDPASITRNDLENTGVIDGTLKLKVRCRMSMSLVFDSVWRWREDFQAYGRINLDSAVKNPTIPDSTAEPPASSVLDPPLPINQPPGGMMQLQNSGLNIIQGFPASAGASLGPSYEVWDPLSWTLDGFVDMFPMQIPGIEGTSGPPIS